MKDVQEYFIVAYFKYSLNFEDSLKVYKKKAYKTQLKALSHFRHYALWRCVLVLQDSAAHAN